MNRNRTTFWIGVAGIAPVVVGAALVAVRGVTVGTNLALVLVTVVVAVAAAGGWKPGAVAAVTAALSFDFFLTKPYLQLRIDSRDDIETTVLLLVVGLIVGHVAARGRRAWRALGATHGEVLSVHRVAETAARGGSVEDVIGAAETELTALLHLAAVRFERAPFPAGDTAGDGTALDLPAIEPTGVVVTTDHWSGPDGFELPRGGVVLPVRAGGDLLGRFVLTPVPEAGVALPRRIAAVAIADQVGAVVAALANR